MPRPPKTANNQHYFAYPSIPPDEQQARKEQEQAVSEAPKNPTEEQIKARKTADRLSLLAAAQELGDELLEVWELDDDKEKN